jgi:hypothetical protein
MINQPMKSMVHENNLFAADIRHHGPDESSLVVCERMMGGGRGL